MLSRVSLRSSTLSSTLCRSASTGFATVPNVKNEPMLSHAPGTPERAALQAELAKRLSLPTERIPIIINGKEEWDGEGEIKQRMPTKHAHIIAKGTNATKEQVNRAIKGALKAKAQWENLPFEERASVFLKAADLLSTKYRAEVNAVTMLGTGKNAWQAEIDAAVETIDFWRFNAKYAEQIYRQQPPENSFGVWNRMDYRPLTGYVTAITPFNFLAIGSNLCCGPAQMGNVVLWKPSSDALLGSYLIYQILRESGLPDGVIQFLPGGVETSKAMIRDRQMGGLHFTGSTKTFDTIWGDIAKRLNKYEAYPRIVGETGGKNFCFVHPSAVGQDDNIINSLIRGAFEYNGQKCSATSRVYVPNSIWERIRDPLVEKTKSLKIGQPDEMDTFVTAVINRASYDRSVKALEYAAANPDTYKVLCGGRGHDSVGYIIEPTIVESNDVNCKLMTTEFFSPILTVVPYEDSKVEKYIAGCATNKSGYALTGSIFANDRLTINKLTNDLRHAAGNFYINDKSTGSLVGQQPFGGGGRSGTNDKSGSMLNLLRWTSARSIKDSFVPISNYTYPHMTK